MSPARSTTAYPKAFLAAGRAVVAVLEDSRLRVWRDGAVWSNVTTPFTPTVCALAPAGDRIVVAADGVVAVVHLLGAAPSRPVAVEGRPSKLALRGEVVATVVRRGPISELAWWSVGESDRLAMAPLGDAVVWSLELGDTWALVWGMRGDGAASGRGNPFVNVVSLSDERGGEVLWDGADLASAPIGVAVVDGGSCLACHDGQDLEVWRVGGDLVERLVDVPATEIAASPDGRVLALRRSSWESKGDVHAFSVVELGERHVTEVGELHDLGLHHEFAVSDAGRLWLARTLPPDTVSVLASGPGPEFVEEIVSIGA